MMSMLIACHSDAEDVGKESSPPLLDTPAKGRSSVMNVQK